LRELFLKNDGQLSTVGWIILMVVAVVPTTMLAGALELPTWLDWTISLLWIVAVTMWSRRVLGVRF
jgi:hypothetical protein